MFKSLKFKTANTPVFFWSDMHYNHSPISGDWLHKSRGFNSLTDHDAALIERWNNQVSQNGIVFHLGDICLGQNSEDNFRILCNTLNFSELYVMSGNHFAGLKQAARLSAIYNGGNFICDELFRIDITSGCALGAGHNKKIWLIPNYFEIFVDGQAIAMSHYPLASWNGMAGGSWFIHGHCHSNLKKSCVGQELYRGKIIDVGVENFPRPASFEDIKAIMATRSAIKTDHHNENTHNPF